MRIDLRNKGIQWVMLLVLGFIWGTSYILMKRGLVAFSAGHVAALRLSIAFIALLPCSILNFRKLNRKNFMSILIISLMGIGIPAFLFTNAQTQVSSSVAGVLNSLTPLFTLLIGVWIYKAKSNFSSLIGVFLGLVGASALIIMSTGFSISDINGYSFLIVLATFCYGINSNEIKYKLKHLNGLEITSMVMILIGPPAIIYLFTTGFNPVHFTSKERLGVLYIALLALFGTVIAVVIFNQLLKYVSAVSATSVSYISPVFAIMWGLFDGESFGIAEFFCLILIIAGVYLVNKNQINGQKS
jgi:drug/metabolite transporter (DMT)-like permease